jgi:hypothetical protein
MIWLMAKRARAGSLGVGYNRRRTTGAATAFWQQSEGFMREEWKELDVLALATEEPDTFDRKSGLIFQKSQDDFFNGLAKAVSAFANSGGGALIIGVEDDGTFSGVLPNVGRTSTKDWLEQKIPTLVSYPLVLFRVHTVIPSIPTMIPAGKILIVVEVGDSPAAPHQSVRDHKYYYRVGGRSEPAKHFYVELLRQRLSSPTLDFTAEFLTPVHIGEYEGRLFLEVKIKCRITNLGRVAAYKWALSPRSLHNEAIKDFNSTFVHSSNFPLKRGRSGGIRVDDTILPGMSMTDDIDLGFILCPVEAPVGEIKRSITDMISALVVGCQLATETSPGEVKDISLKEITDVDNLVVFVQNYRSQSEI